MVFGFSLLVAVAAVGKGAVQMSATDPAKPRESYAWDAEGLEGGSVYRSMGCNN